MMSMRTIGLIAAGLASGAALAVVFAQAPASPPTASAPQVTGKAQVGGPFALTDHTGKRVTEKDFLGKSMVVFFGFTNCPDICPSGLQVLSAALDKLGDKAAEVTPVFITLDAKRDTPEKLAAYLKSFDGRIVGLTGTEDEVSKAAKAYRVFSQKIVDDNSPESYSYDHSALFYVMGKDGAFLAPIAETTDPSAVAAEIAKAIS